SALVRIDPVSSTASFPSSATRNPLSGPGPPKRRAQRADDATSPAPSPPESSGVDDSRASLDASGALDPSRGGAFASDGDASGASEEAASAEHAATARERIGTRLGLCARILHG